MEQHILETLQGELHYWMTGKGPETLVFLHGLGEEHSVFEAQAAFFQQDFRVIVPDIPGHGASRPWKDFDLVGIAEMMHRVLIREGVDRVHLVGYAEGGFLAQAYVSAFSGRLRSVTLIGTPPFGKKYHSAGNRLWLRGGEIMTKLLPLGMKNTTALGLRASTHEGRVRLHKGRTLLTKKELAFLQSTYFTAYLEWKTPVSMRVPVLLVTGEKDPSPVTQKLFQRWSNQEGHLLDVVHGAGHAAHLDQPEEFNAKLQGFLNRVVKPRDFSNVWKAQNAMLDPGRIE